MNFEKRKKLLYLVYPAAAGDHAYLVIFPDPVYVALSSLRNNAMTPE
jgi:hypothetical protein